MRYNRVEAPQAVQELRSRRKHRDVIRFVTSHPKEAEFNAAVARNGQARMMACLEACRGVPTELLHPGVVREQIQQQTGQEALIAELVEALRSARETATFEHHPFRAWHHDADTVLAKVETR